MSAGLSIAIIVVVIIIVIIGIAGIIEKDY